MKPTLIIISCLHLFCSPINAQNEPTSTANTKFLIGINITNTLAGFFNSGGQTLPKDPYLLSFKVLKGNKLWRIGGNFKVDLSQEEVDFGGIRNIRESEALLRLGREWQQPINKRFILYYGADMVGSYFQETSEVEFFNDLGSKSYQYGAGAGPFLGVYFLLGDRVRLSTESYAYAIFYLGESNTSIGQGVPNDLKKVRRFSVAPAIPNSLYIHFAF